MELEILEMNNNQAVSGRLLHEELDIKTKYNDWINKYISKYDLLENDDFLKVTQKKVTNNPKNPITEVTDHVLKLEHAKKICMVTNNEIGNKIRNYFLECEKQLQNQLPTDPLELALHTINVITKHTKQLEQKVNVLETTIVELEPKINYVDNILNSKGLTITSTIASDYGMSAVSFNKLLKELKIQYKQSGIWFLYQNYKGNGYVKTSTIEYSKGNFKDLMKWTQKGRLFLYEKLKENDVLPEIEKGE